MKIFLLIADLGNTALFQNKAPGSLSFPSSEKSNHERLGNIQI